MIPNKAGSAMRHGSGAGARAPVTDPEADPSGGLGGLPDDADVDMLYGHISGLAATNEDLIKRIDGMKDVDINYFQYLAPPAVSQDGTLCSFELQEVLATDKAGEIVKRWKKRIELIDIYDLFTRNIEYRCENYADLVRLNGAMKEVTARYHRFYDTESKKGRVELRLFVTNLERVRAGLREVWGLCHDQPSKADRLLAMMAHVNEVLMDAMGEGVRYTPPGHPALQQIGLTKDMRAALKSWIPAPAADAWKLKYQASLDGYRGANFHGKCDGVQRLLVLVRSNGGWLFGAFTGQAFRSVGSHVPDDKAFLFTLHNPHGIPPTKLSRSGQGQEIYDHQNHGPTYGQSDLYICDSCNNSANSVCNAGVFAYTDPTGMRATLFTGEQMGWTVTEVLAFEV